MSNVMVFMLVGIWPRPAQYTIRFLIVILPEVSEAFLSLNAAGKNVSHFNTFFNERG